MKPWLWALAFTALYAVLLVWSALRGSGATATVYALAAGYMGAACLEARGVRGLR